MSHSEAIHAVAPGHAFDDDHGFLVDQRPWTASARCAQSDPEMWFPEGSQITRGDAQAKAICVMCPVRRDCAEYAIDLVESGENLSGIWAGTRLISRASGDAPQALRKLRGVLAEIDELEEEIGWSVKELVTA